MSDSTTDLIQRYAIASATIWSATIWAALHREDGMELHHWDAPGYSRAPWSGSGGCSWPEVSEDWGDVAFWSLWDAETGGNVVSTPALQVVKREWLHA